MRVICVQILSQGLASSVDRWCWAVVLSHCPTTLTIKRLAKCSIRGGSKGMYIKPTFASAMPIREPTLASNLRGDVTRNPKRGHQWPQIRAYGCVCQKHLKVH